MIDFFYYHWGPYLLKTEVPQYIVDRLLIDGKNKLKSYNTELAGHLNNQFIYNDDTQFWFINEIAETLNAYRQGHIEYHGENYHGKIQEGRTTNFELDSLWVNYMKPGDYNPRHGHSGDLSFIIFLDIPNELHKEQSEFKGRGTPPASLTFHYTPEARPQWATTSKTFRPRTGEMFIFPALLEHTVIPFKSGVTRITVSGNINMT